MLRAPRRKPDTAAPPIHIGYTDGSLTMTSKKSVPSSSTIYALERNPVNVTMRPPKIWRRCAMCDVKTGDLRPTSRHAVTRAGSRRVEDHNGFGHFRIQRRTASCSGNQGPGDSRGFKGPGSIYPETLCPFTYREI